jgi:hypothetical protein
MLVEVRPIVGGLVVVLRQQTLEHLYRAVALSGVFQFAAFLDQVTVAGG